ncbi:MAG: YfcE family phosphodiesterase [Asgard group archaeon]|nr:YfcE family phosphodiesterase [Asgard group archaeon]
MSFKIFVAGDLHIPSRATMLHPKFQTMLENEKWDYIVLTGDYTTQKVLSSFKQYLKNPDNLIACRGNMDVFPLPERPIFEIAGIKFGVFHGTGIYPRGDIKQLKQIANEMDVKILFTGHSHKVAFYFDEEHVILNPGTSSGASGGSSWTVDTGVFSIQVLSSNEISVELFELTNKDKIRTVVKKIPL